MTFEQFKAKLLDPTTAIKRRQPETIEFQKKLVTLPEEKWKFMYDNYLVKSEVGEYIAMNCVITYVNNYYIELGGGWKWSTIHQCGGD